MFKKVLLLTLVLVIGVVTGGFFLYKASDYVRITKVDYKAVVVDEKEGDNGKVHVTERITYDIHAASKENLYWELWRDLVEEQTEGIKVYYKVLSVKQINPHGSEIVYKPASKLYWDDVDYVYDFNGTGPKKWYHSEGPYDGVRNFECVLFYVDGIYREEMVFEVEYEMYNASMHYADSSELYLPMYSGDNLKYLQEFKAQILIPSDKMPKDFDVYTYGTNFETFPLSESDTINHGYHTFSFNLDKNDLKFKHYNNYIEFALIAKGEDKHKFTRFASVNDNSEKDMLEEINGAQSRFEELPGLYLKKKLFLATWLIGLTTILALMAMTVNNIIKKRFKFFEPSEKIYNYQEIPSNLDPSFAAIFVFCKGKNPIKNDDQYAATLLSLVQKGYVELVSLDDSINRDSYVNSQNIKMVIKDNPFAAPSVDVNDIYAKMIEAENEQPENINDIYAKIIEEEKRKVADTREPLSKPEERYLRLIIRHTNTGEISMRTFQNKVESDYQNTVIFTSGFRKDIIQTGTENGYYQVSNIKRPRNIGRNWGIFYLSFGVIVASLFNYLSYQTRYDLAFGAYFILGIGMILAGTGLILVSRKYVLLTQLGADEYEKWRGLYNFLNSDTLLEDKTAIEVVIWEKYLVYATAFGIADKVIKALKLRVPLESTSSPILNNTYYRNNFFYNSAGRSFYHATSRAYNTSTLSSGGSYGGYGGWSGGRGGGSGGGGH